MTRVASTEGKAVSCPELEKGGGGRWSPGYFAKGCGACTATERLGRELAGTTGRPAWGKGVGGSVGLWGVVCVSACECVCVCVSVCVWRRARVISHKPHAPPARPLKRLCRGLASEARPGESESLPRCSRCRCGSLHPRTAAWPSTGAQALQPLASKGASEPGRPTRRAGTQLPV